MIYISVRNHWNKDYKPGPYPKTPQERLAAIEKYQVMPSTYEAYEDDGRGCGDYPKLPLVSGDGRDPFYPWDQPDARRNYNEMIQAEEDFYSEVRYDISARLRTPLRIQFLQTFGVIFTLFLIYTGFEQVKCFHSVAEKQYPAPGVKHYTFDVEK